MTRATCYVLRARCDVLGAACHVRRAYVPVSVASALRRKLHVRLRPGHNQPTRRAAMQRFARMALALVCAAGLGAVLSGASGPAASWNEAVDAVFEPFTRPGSPGCAVAVYKDGKIA